MGDRSGIEWTDATWNPTTGCDRVSPGCAHCYALDLAARMKAMGKPAYQADGDPRTSGPGFALTLHPDRLGLPLRWTRPRRVFVNSMSDLFHEQVPDSFIDQVFAVMAMAPQHTFQLLTKRPERMRAYLTTTWGDGFHEPQHDRLDAIAAAAIGLDFERGLCVGGEWPLPKVWLGTSVENQTWADRRIPELLATPAAVRFLSMEPLLGPVDLSAAALGSCNCNVPWLDGDGMHSPTCRVFRPRVDWVIVGGESGPDHRPVDPSWVRSLRDQSERARIPFLFKQWGGRTPKSGGRELDGRTWDEYPAVAA